MRMRDWILNTYQNTRILTSFYFLRLLLEDMFELTDSHFEMLTIPSNLNNKDDSTSKYTLPTFPITVGDSILDYVAME